MSLSVKEKKKKHDSIHGIYNAVVFPIPLSRVSIIHSVQIHHLFMFSKHLIMVRMSPLCTHTFTFRGNLESVNISEWV